MNWNEAKQMEEIEYNYLSTIKKHIKSYVRRESEFDKVMETIEDVFHDDFMDYWKEHKADFMPENSCIFDAMSTSEFFSWCKENIEGFVGYEVDRDPEYSCRIKD